MSRLEDENASLAQQLADLTEANRVLTEAAAKMREDALRLTEALERSEADNALLRRDLAREQADAESLREQLAEAADMEEEARRLDRKLDSIAAEKANYETRIANLRQTIEEMKRNLPGQQPANVTFQDLEEEGRTAARQATRRHFYGEAYRPASPPSPPDRNWLDELPDF